MLLSPLRLGPGKRFLNDIEHRPTPLKAAPQSRSLPVHTKCAGLSKAVTFSAVTCLEELQDHLLLSLGVCRRRLQIEKRCNENPRDQRTCQSQFCFSRYRR